MKLETNGVELYYEVTGQGPPFLLLHGNSEDHTIFGGLVDKLKSRYTCYAIDSRGHGQSGPASEMCYDAMATDVAGFITALELDKPVLLGASDGGIVGLLVAINHPGLLGGLIACGANTNPRQLKLWFRALCSVGLRATGDDKLRMMLTQPDITPAQLGAITVPTLIVAGKKDILPRHDTEAIAAAIPGATLRILPGEDHSSYITHSERIFSVIRPFLHYLKRQTASHE